jgi:UDP-GlcNAc3NAcA epimerase
VGSGPHGEQTGSMLKGIEKILISERPDWLLVYGDTNSTLSGALAAAKLHMPVAHIEAGLRSFNRRMPEEINRVVTDHLSSMLLCPSGTAVNNLAAEGITDNVHLTGDVMLDVLNWAIPRIEGGTHKAVGRLDLTPKGYILATVHRCENTDDPLRLASILRSFNAIEEPVVFPAHPRTRKAIARSDIRPQPHVRIIDPLGYVEMLTLSRSARLILTDSGGLQKEAYWLRVPCLTLRDETEWIETVESGWNKLVGTEVEMIVQAVGSFAPPSSHPPLYGNGRMAEKFVGLF